MRIQCENCQASYNIPDEKVQGRAFKFQCKKCGNLVRYRPEEAPAKMTMEVQASDVQPRMTGEMAAAAPDKTVFQPPTQAEVRQGPRRKAKYGDSAPQQEQAQQADTQQTPRMTMEGKALTDLPEKAEGQWYLAYSKNKRGPHNVAEIEAHLVQVRPKGDIYVWKAGFDSWKRIQEVPEFAEAVRKLTQPAARPAPTPEPKPEAPAPEPAQPAQPPRPRPTFTELLKSELGEENDAAKPKTSQKIDISELMGDNAGKTPPFGMPAEKNKKKKAVVIEEYVPPTKKKIPWIPIIVLLVLFVVVVGTPLVLAYKHIIEIPGLDEAPVIGQYFKKVEVDHYAELRAKWEMLVKIDETKVAMQATKAAEEQQLLEEERRKAEKEKAERRQRVQARRQQLAKSNPNVTVFDFGDGPDGTEMETEGELQTANIDRMAALSQDQVNGIVRQNMRSIAKCVASQKDIDASVRGTMSVRFTVSRRGSVVRANVTSSQFQGTYVADCVETTIERIRFPRSGGSVTVTYPFNIQ